MITNKHIIRLLFIGLLLHIAANIVLYRYFMIEELVLKQTSIRNTHIAELYKKKIWNHNKQSLSTLANSSLETLLHQETFVQFVKNSYQFFIEDGDDISLYDKNGRKFIESKINEDVNVQYNQSDYLYNKLVLQLDKYFLSNYLSKKPLESALKGKSEHYLASRAIVTDKNQTKFEKSFIISYIPIIDTTNGAFAIEGVIQINTDITDQWNGIILIEQRMFLSFFIVFAIFFAITMYNTYHAQKIIQKQFGINRSLEEKKSKAESDNSAKTQFLANISHELRTPLNTIIGFSEIIISNNKNKVNTEQNMDYVTDINNSGKHLLSVINDILDFSKASADKLQVDNIDLDLNKLAMASIRFVKPRADASNIQLIEILPKHHVVIKADPKRLKQALLNLLSNAVKFTPTDGSVTLSVTKHKIQDIVYIKVIDTGIGMSEKDIPKALSSFGQIDNKLSRKYEGTGLGLPLTKKLVELMNGTFDITSKPGKGTTVTLGFKCNSMYNKVSW